MKIKLADESLLPDLLAFLRKEGCVAYYEGGGIEAVRPNSFGEREAAELRVGVENPDSAPKSEFPRPTPAARDETSVPTQQRRRRDEERSPARPRQQPTRCSKKGRDRSS